MQSNPVITVIMCILIIILSARLVIKQKKTMWTIPLVLYILYLILNLIGLCVQSNVLDNMKTAMNLVGWISIWSIIWQRDDEDVQLKGDNKQ